MQAPVRIVELRIHGVSGTPPESMLRESIGEILEPGDVEQVAGDDLTGFYRVRATKRSQDPDHIVEAYNWGQLTSGNWKKALWFLLVPFGLLNAAHFMLPGGSSGDGTIPDDHHVDSAWPRRLRIAAQALLRLLGVVMTAAFTLGTAEALVDLVGWQWTGLATSAQDAVGARYPDPRGWLAGALVVAGLVPAASLWFGGGRSPGAGEPVAPVAPVGQRPAGMTTAMTGREFDVGNPAVQSLRRIHLGVVGALLGHIGLSVYRQYGGANSSIGSFNAAHGTAICAAVLVIAIFCATVFGNPHRSSAQRTVARSRQERGVAGLSWSILLAGALLCIIGCISVLTCRSVPADHRRPLPGLPGLCNAAVVVGLSTIAVLMLINAGMALMTKDRSVPIPFRRYLFGMMSTVIAAMAAFLGVGLAAATAFWTRYLLLKTTADHSMMTPPLIFDRIAHAWGVTTVEIAAIGAVLLILWSVQHNSLANSVRIAHNVHPYRDEEEQGPPSYHGLAHPCDLTPSAISRVATYWWLARIKYHLQWILGALALFGLLLAILNAFAAATDNHTAVWNIFLENAATVCVDASGPAATPAVGWLVSCTGYGGPFFVAAGSSVLLALGATLVYLGRKSLSDNGLRRSVNVVWDIIAFWPRAAHPLVPAPYTAKALDELRRRIYFHLALCAMPQWHGNGQDCTCAKSGNPAGRVVLAPHSQGSLLAVAAVAGLRMNDDGRGVPGPGRAIRYEEMAMVSYGSQLQFAYARGFPAYVDYTLIDSCRNVFTGRTGSRWINLMRETDPIGGQVFSDARHDDFTSRTIVTRFRERELDSRLRNARPGAGVRICGGMEWRLLDPIPTDGETVERRPVFGHANYFLDPAWADVIAALADTSGQTVARRSDATGRNVAPGSDT